MQSVIISTISGIVGTVTTLASAYVTVKSRFSKHKSNVQQANREIIVILRPFIAEAKFPRKEAINAIIATTAIRYDLKESDILSINRLFHSCLLEIAEFGFLPVSEKIKMFNTVFDQITQFSDQKTIKYKKTTNNVSSFVRQYKTAIIVSCILGLLATLGAALLLRGVQGSSVNSSINLLFKLAGIGILLMVFSQVITQADKKERAQLLTLAGIVIVMMFIVNLLGDFFNASLKLLK